MEHNIRQLAEMVQNRDPIIFKSRYLQDLEDDRKAVFDAFQELKVAMVEMDKFPKFGSNVCCPECERATACEADWWKIRKWFVVTLKSHNECGKSEKIYSTYHQIVTKKSQNLILIKNIKFLHKLCFENLKILNILAYPGYAIFTTLTLPRVVPVFTLPMLNNNFRSGSNEGISWNSR